MSSIHKSATDCNSPLNNQNRLPQLALRYAQLGYSVLPLRPGTKEPFKVEDNLPGTGRGVHDATTDIAQIREWWRECPQANIGITGLILIDVDIYKDPAGAADWLAKNQLALTPTITVKSARGGLHFWYRMPAGKRYGNSRGNLPKFIDIKGYGGYVVAPPSVFVQEGKPLSYSFVPRHKPTDLDAAPLPALIRDALEQSPQKPTEAPTITFASSDPAKPNLGQWRLSEEVRGLIEKGVPRGQRSEAMFAVYRGLRNAGASPDDLRAVMTHYPIGAKAQQKGDKWLRADIGRAIAKLSATSSTVAPASAALDVQIDPMVAALPDLLTWVESAGCIEALRASGFKRPADYQKTLWAMVDYANTRRVKRVQLSIRQLTKLTTLSKSVISRQLIKLVNLGWLTVANTEDDYARIFDLTPLFALAKIDRSLSGTPSAHSLAGGSGSAAAPSGLPREGGCPTSRSFIGAHLADEAFVSYPYRFATQLRPHANPFPRGLNSVALFLAACLYEHGDLPATQIAMLSGFSLATARDGLRRMTNLGLLFVETVGRRKFYSLHPNFEEQLDAVREWLPSYGLGQRLAGEIAGARADYLAKRLQSRSPLDAGERAKLEARRDKYDALQAAHRDAAAAMGLDLSAQLAPRRATRHHMTIDPVAAYERQHKPVLDAYNRLGTMPHDDKIHTLAVERLADDCTKEEYAIAYRQMTQRLREAHKAAHQLDLRRQRQLDAVAKKPVAILADDDWLLGPLAAAPFGSPLGAAAD